MRLAMKEFVLPGLCNSPRFAAFRIGLLTGRYQQRFGDEFMPYDHYDPAFMKNLRSHYGSLKKSIPGLATMKPNFFVNREKFNDGMLPRK
jgi:hypothetical protein